MKKIRVLVVADATPMRQDVVDAIEQDVDLELVGTAVSAAQALAAVRDVPPDVVLVNETLGDVNTLALTEDLATRYPEVTVIAMTQEGHMDYVREAMLAGARGFVTTPLVDGELSQVLRQIRRLELSRQTRLAPVAAENQKAVEGTIIAIYSPKGGVGKTTLTANLGVALAKQSHARVALVDNNPQFGHLGLVLNVHANYSLMDLLTRADDLEPEMVEGMLASHSSGIQVLLAPGEIERADAFPPQTVTKVLAILQTMFNWIVVDTWPVLTESTLDVLETADQVFLMLVPDITCLRDTKQFLDLVESLNFPLNKFEIIVNRATEGGLERDVIEETLRRKVAMEIPQDDPLVTHSLNKGVPLVISHKRSPVSKAIMQLAERLTTGGKEPTIEERGLRTRMKRVLNAVG